MGIKSVFSAQARTGQGIIVQPVAMKKKIRIKTRNVRKSLF